VRRSDVLHRRVCHHAAALQVPRIVALTGPLQRGGKDVDFERLERPVWLRRNRRADEVSLRDVRERGAHDADHAKGLTERDRLCLRSRAHDNGVRGDRDDAAADVDRRGGRRVGKSRDRCSEKRAEQHGSIHEDSTISFVADDGGRRTFH
jgi:hypothetical protein